MDNRKALSRRKQGFESLGSATSFAQSFRFKTLAARLCKRDAVFV
jgi:hypothetical protein